MVFALFKNVNEANPTGTIITAYQKNVGMKLAIKAVAPNPTAPPSR